MWRKTTSLEVYILRYPPMTEGSRGQRWIILGYTPIRRWFYYITLILCPPPTFFFRSTFSYSRVPVRFPPNERNNVNIQPCPIFTVLQWGYQPGTITNSTCLILTRLEVENSYFSMAFRRSFNPAINNSTNVKALTGSSSSIIHDGTSKSNEVARKLSTLFAEILFSTTRKWFSFKWKQQA